MRIIRTEPFDPPHEPPEDQIAVAVLWAAEGALLIECKGASDRETMMEHSNSEHGTATAYVLDGSYRAVIAAHGEVPEREETVTRGTFNHDDRPEWQAGAMVRYEASAGARWWCFNQPWLPAAQAENLIYIDEARIPVPPGAVLVIIDGTTSEGDGTFVVLGEEADAVVELRSGRAWLMRRTDDAQQNA